MIAKAVATNQSFFDTITFHGPPERALGKKDETQSESLKPSQTREALYNEIKKELRIGRIPEVLQDELRMCPLDTEPGIKFQTSMEALAKRFCKHWDIHKNPIRFFLMDRAGMNACQIRDADPPLIGFTRGCFINLSDEQGVEKESFEFLDEAAECLAHEGVHLVIEGKYSPKKVTKGEEAIAEGAAVEVLHDAGFDAKKALDSAQKRLKMLDRRSIGKKLLMNILHHHRAYRLYKRLLRV